MIKYTGAKAVPYNLTEQKDLSINPDKILSLINEKTRLLILNNPHNPTGSFTEKTVIDKLAKGLVNFPQVVILSDDFTPNYLWKFQLPNSIENDIYEIHEEK